MSKQAMVAVSEARKVFALLFAVVLFLLSFVHGVCYLRRGVVWWCRFGYQFFHFGPVHALCNIWVLLSMVFLSGVPLRRFVVGWVLSALVPGFLLSVSVCGFSGVLYVVLGRYVTLVRCPVRYCLWCMGFLCVGFVVPHIAVAVHFCCFVYGVLWALVRFPVNVC